MRAVVVFKLVQSHPTHYLIHLIVHLSQNAFERSKHVSEQLMVRMAFACVFDNHFKEGLITSDPECWLTQLIVGHFICIFGVLAANLTYLLICLLQILQTLLGSLSIQDVVSV